MLNSEAAWVAATSTRALDAKTSLGHFLQSYLKHNIFFIY